MTTLIKNPHSSQQNQGRIKLDLFFLLGNGIGNVIAGLYAVEYVLQQKYLRIGFCVFGVPESFKKYLVQCYGDCYFFNTHNLNIDTTYLIQSFLVDPKIKISFKSYFYINSDAKSTFYQTETEQYLSIVKSLYPSGYVSKTLRLLKGEETPWQNKLNISKRIVLYPGCSPRNAAKRWPHYFALISKLGEKNTIVIGDKGDLDFSYSYIYPKYISFILSQKLMDKRKVWSSLKNIGLLQKFTHQNILTSVPDAFFGVLSWHEIVNILKKCRFFIGNDGGITHLAAAAGARGIVIFGPTSIEKNKPFNKLIEPLNLGLECQPCQFGKAGITMSRGFINCPYGVKCLQNIDSTTIYQTIVKMEVLG